LKVILVVWIFNSFFSHNFHYISLFPCSKVVRHLRIPHSQNEFAFGSLGDSPCTSTHFPFTRGMCLDVSFTLVWFWPLFICFVQIVSWRYLVSNIETRGSRLCFCDQNPSSHLFCWNKHMNQTMELVFH
jgi:hypothetical protein